MEKDLVLYILMRNDLASMTPGRCMAQASHASNAFIHRWGKQTYVKDWQNQTEDGFGTAIVLAADLLSIQSIAVSLCDNGYNVCGEVIDPEYSYVVPHEFISLINEKFHVKPPFSKADGTWMAFREETTCFYAFGDRNDQVFKGIFSNLKLF